MFYGEGGGGGHGFGGNNHSNESNDYQMAGTFAVEHRTIKYGRGISVEQSFDGRVAFTIEGWKQKYEQRKHQASGGHAQRRVFEAFEEILHHVHHACEVQRHQSAYDAQENDQRNFGGEERLALCEEEFEVVPRVYIGYCGGSH